jgi:hypothetical protein
MEIHQYKELQEHSEECAKLAISAPTAALREQYAELSKVWAGLAAQHMKAGSNGRDLESGPLNSAVPAE